MKVITGTKYDQMTKYGQF